MPPIDTSALAAIFAWVWSQYGKTITDKTLKAAWERLRWEDRAWAYAAKVQRIYGTMQILGQAKPVPLEGIYTAISLLDRLTALNRYTVEKMQAEFVGRGDRYFHAQGDEENRRDGLEMVKGGENLFILGKPGAGKTTFLKHVALRGVSGDLDRVPIFVGLKQLSDSGLSVFDFVVREFDECDFPDAAAYLNRLMKSGRAVLLFDGLDEVNVADDERKRLIANVENFTRKYDQCQRLITCRLAANEYVFQNYIYVEMADFNQTQISEFVAKWFSGDKKQRERRDLFLSELQKSESEGLRELARVPLLLALLCLGFEDTLKLSSHRVELYGEALDALLKKWDAGRNIQRDEVYRALTLNRKEQMLAQIAAETFYRAEYFIPKKTLAQGFEDFLSRVPDVPSDLDGNDVLRAIVVHHGLFTERAYNIYSFAHLTFQEYFTARYIVENEARGTLQLLMEHYNDPRYREVFLLTASQLPDATEFFNLFIDRLQADAFKRPAVSAFLRQAAQKAVTPGKVSLGAGGRILYVYLFLALILVFDRERTLNLDRIRALDLAQALAKSLTLTLVRARALAIVFTRELSLALGRSLILAEDLERDNALGLDHILVDDRERANTLARDLERHRSTALKIAFPLTREVSQSHDLTLGREAALVNAWLSLQIATNSYEDKLQRDGWLEVACLFVTAAAVQVIKSRENNIAVQLTDLEKRMAGGVEGTRVPDHFSRDLVQILAKSNLVFPRRLNEGDLSLLKTYFNGNLFLLECLSQAVVPNRDAIKERLLLLPPE